MNKKEICKKLDIATNKIILLSGDKVISSGTGVAVRNDGVLLTANHVVSEFTKISNPKIIVISKGSGNGISHLEYQPTLYNVSLNVNLPERILPIIIDLAILKSIQRIDLKNNFIPLEDNLEEEGADVLLAGFPDEIKLPLNFDSYLNFDNPEMAEKKEKIAESMNFFMALMMIKSGMIGAVHKINLQFDYDSKNFTAAGASYWIDNASTYGASGGAVVNFSGNLVGIICQKGMTKLLPSGGYIPSGSTMALSHKLISWGLYLCD